MGALQLQLRQRARVPAEGTAGTEVRIELPERVTAGDDLPALIGSWQEDAGFDAAVRAFEQVDEALWQ